MTSKTRTIAKMSKPLIFPPRRKRLAGKGLFRAVIGRDHDPKGSVKYLVKRLEGFKAQRWWLVLASGGFYTKNREREWSRLCICEALLKACWRTPSDDVNESGGRSQILLDDLVRGCEQAWRKRDADRLGRLQVDRQLERGRILDRQVGRSRTLQDAIDIGGGAAELLGAVGAVGHQATLVDEGPAPEHRRHARFIDGCQEKRTVGHGEEVRQHQQAAVFPRSQGDDRGRVMDRRRLHRHIERAASVPDRTQHQRRERRGGGIVDHEDTG